MRIGFIGLGNMGAAIAGNLLRAGHDVAIWNRTASKAQPLIRAGAVLLSDARSVCAGREIVFTMLADDEALDSVLEGHDGMLAGLGPGSLHVSMSTISVAGADRMAAQHGRMGQRLLSAPVFGRPEAAAAAKLFVVAAGPRADFDRAAPLLAAVSQRVFHVGDSASAANLVKICGNFMILAAIETLGEALALAEKGGIPKSQLLEILTNTLFDSPLYRNYGSLIVDGKFRPAGFAASLGLKDMRLAGAAAEGLRLPMPVLNVLRDHLLQTIAQNGEDIDWSAIALTTARNAGL